MNIQKNLSRIGVLTIFFLFSIPFMLSAWFFKHPEKLPQTHTNKGQLIQPLHSSQEFKLDFSQSKNPQAWKLVYVTGSECSKACQEDLFTMRQVKKTLGKNTERLQNILLISPKNNNKKLQWILTTGAPQMLRQDAQPAQIAMLQNKLAADQNPHAYLVDPHGWIFMRYNAPLIPKDIYTDIKHLFKFSQIG